MKIIICKIDGNEIHNKELKKYYNKLDVKKRIQIEKYTESFDKSRCFIAHLIVYLYYKGNVSYEYNSNGRISNCNSNDYFNISYSEKYIVVAFNDNKVGIDIEKINQITKDELDYYASDNEKKIFVNNLDYIKLWCLKESYLKYLGCGITNDLKNIEFNKNNESYNCKNTNGLYINVFQIDKNYICSVITDNVKQVDIDIEFVELSKITDVLNEEKL